MIILGIYLSLLLLLPTTAMLWWSRRQREYEMTLSAPEPAMVLHGPDTATSILIDALVVRPTNCGAIHVAAIAGRDATTGHAVRHRLSARRRLAGRDGRPEDRYGIGLARRAGLAGPIALRQRAPASRFGRMHLPQSRQTIELDIATRSGTGQIEQRRLTVFAAEQMRPESWPAGVWLHAWDHRRQGLISLPSESVLRAHLATGEAIRDLDRWVAARFAMPHAA